MIKVIFYLKASKTTKSGECPIFARTTPSGESLTISTGRTITKERWQQTDNLRATLRLEKEKIIKNALERFNMDIESIYSYFSKLATLSASKTSSPPSMESTAQRRSRQAFWPSWKSTMRTLRRRRMQATALRPPFRSTSALRTCFPPSFSVKMSCWTWKGSTSATNKPGRLQIAKKKATRQKGLVALPL